MDSLVRYYRNNDKRMRYAELRAAGLPIDSGIVESAHQHVLQARMKQDGQRGSTLRGRRMGQLRALYRTAGPRRFHWAIREMLELPPARATFKSRTHPGRIKRDFVPSKMSKFGRACASE